MLVGQSHENVTFLSNMQTFWYSIFLILVDLNQSRRLNFTLRESAYFAVQHSESNSFLKLKYYFCMMQQSY